MCFVVNFVFGTVLLCIVSILTVYFILWQQKTHIKNSQIGWKKLCVLFLNIFCTNCESFPCKNSTFYFCKNCHTYGTWCLLCACNVRVMYTMKNGDHTNIVRNCKSCTGSWHFLCLKLWRNSQTLMTLWTMYRQDRQMIRTILELQLPYKTWAVE